MGAHICYTACAKQFVHQQADEFLIQAKGAQHVPLVSDVSTLPTRTVRQLTALCEEFDIPTKIVTHAPTFSAAETQAVLPEDCLVQKTITDRVDGKLLLWTGVGDYRLTRALHKAANARLGLAAGRDHTLNPRDIDAFAFYGMQPGMVSPFLMKGTRAVRELSAVFVLESFEYDAARPVAISLSLTESMIVSLEYLRTLLREYADAVYPRIPRFTLTA